MKKRILLVGHSDTNITPLCCAILTCMCQKKKIEDYEFRSCGFWAVKRRKTDSFMQTVAGEMGLDLTEYRSRPISDDDLAWADLIVPQDEMIAKGVREVLHRDTTKMGKIMKLYPPEEATLSCYRCIRFEVMAYCCRFMRKIMTERRERKKKIAALRYEKVQPNQAEQVVRLEQLCFSHPWSLQAVQSELEKPDGHFVAAFDGDTMVGYGSLALVCGVGYINNIAVDPDYRRLGVGGRLLAQLEDFCLQQNAQSITLEVRSRNHQAIGLYQKHGFASCGLRKGFYRAPDDDALIMTKEFTPSAE